MSSSACSATSSIQVSLQDPSKWSEFHPRTEMIVTRRRGRVIFPHLDYVVQGLEPTAFYSIFVHLERVDNVKYKYDHGEWQYAAKGDALLPIKYFEHPDGARSGEHWMQSTVSFSTLKITNDPNTQDPKLIIVQSMHKYQPVVTIRKINEYGEEFRLQLTEFIVVTCYQCDEINDLKKKHNKFASGFRNEKRKRQSSSSTSPESKRTPSTSPVLTPNNNNVPSFQFGYHPYYGNMNMYYSGGAMWNGYGHFDMGWMNGYQGTDENNLR